MSNETMYSVVVLAIEATEDDLYAENVRIHSVMIRPKEAALERAWQFIKNPPAPGKVIRYKVEIHSIDGCLILKYQ